MLSKNVFTLAGLSLLFSLNVFATRSACEPASNQASATLRRAFTQIERQKTHSDARTVNQRGDLLYNVTFGHMGSTTMESDGTYTDTESGKVHLSEAQLKRLCPSATVNLPIQGPTDGILCDEQAEALYNADSFFDSLGNWLTSPARWNIHSSFGEGWHQSHGSNTTYNSSLLSSCWTARIAYRQRVVDAISARLRSCQQAGQDVHEYLEHITSAEQDFAIRKKQITDDIATVEAELNRREGSPDWCALKAVIDRPLTNGHYHDDGTVTVRGGTLAPPPTPAPNPTPEN